MDGVTGGRNARNGRFLLRSVEFKQYTCHRLYQQQQQQLGYASISEGVIGAAEKSSILALVILSNNLTYRTPETLSLNHHTRTPI